MNHPSALRVQPKYLLLFFCRLDLVKMSRIEFAFRGDRDFSLQVRAIDFRIRGFKAIQHPLRRMSVTIPGAVGNDRRFRFDPLNEFF